MAQTRHNLRLQIAKEQARSREEGALTCKKQTDPQNFVKYSHDENCLINASRRRILTIRWQFATPSLALHVKGTVPGRGGTMGRHVIGRLRRPRWTRVRAQSFPRSYLGFWRVDTKAFVGTPVGLPERLIRNFQRASPPLSDGGPLLAATIIQHFLALPIKPSLFSRDDEWSINIFNCSQNFAFARFARKI